MTVEVLEGIFGWGGVFVLGVGLLMGFLALLVVGISRGREGVGALKFAGALLGIGMLILAAGVIVAQLSG